MVWWLFIFRTALHLKHDNIKDHHSHRRLEQFYCLKASLNGIGRRLKLNSIHALLFTVVCCVYVYDRIKASETVCVAGLCATCGARTSAQTTNHIVVPHSPRSDTKIPKCPAKSFGLDVSPGRRRALEGAQPRMAARLFVPNVSRV